MRKKIILSIATFCALCSFKSDHALKMSFTHLTIDEGGQVNLETRIFLDDLTEHLETKYDLQHVDFSTINSNGSKALYNYFKHCFYFEQGNAIVHVGISEVSFTKNKIALVVNTTSSKPLDMSKEVLIVNTILCDFSALQTNDIKYRNKRYMSSIANPKIKLKTL